MKIFIKILLFLFITFLTMPTLEIVLDVADVDMCVIYNFSEEEKTIKEVKLDFKHESHVFLVFVLYFFPTVIYRDHVLEYACVFEEIFDPPPNQYCV